MSTFQLQSLPTRAYPLADVKEPQLYREQFPYTEVPRILFDGTYLPPNPPGEIWITDTSFRDGQQARPPYRPEQIVDLYAMLHRLGGPDGLVRQCEFFLYSKRDREALEGCQALGYRFPEITGWIRANAEDFKLVKSLGLAETGILTSVSDYHTFLKLKKNRAKAMDDYLGIVKAALAEGIVPRCHFEDVTRADIYGFCLPFAEELLRLSEESGIPIKVRLCDTLGYGVTYPGAALPRSVPRLAHAFCRELGFPSERLEWHGHNDFHHVHSNAASAWLYGISALNASLLGYGERCGNPPLEAAVIEYLQLTGRAEGIETTVITEIADYLRNTVHAEIASNYPFVGSEFNTTRAGVHADGIMKNPEIYNIFDTERILNRPLVVGVTDKSGVAGIAHWLNEYASEYCGQRVEPISKRHPGVRRIYDWTMEQYAQGRTTSISPAEMIAQAKRHLPEIFESDFQRTKLDVMSKARLLADRIARSAEAQSMDPELIRPLLKQIVRGEPTVQFVVVVDLDGNRVSHYQTQPDDKSRYRPLLAENFAGHDWFARVSETGEPYISDLYVSKFTGAMTMTIAHPIRDAEGEIAGIIDVDFDFVELTKLLSFLPEDILAAESPYRT